MINLKRVLNTKDKKECHNSLWSDKELHKNLVFIKTITWKYFFLLNWKVIDYDLIFKLSCALLNFQN